jgi:hypothetical protein
MVMSEEKFTTFFPLIEYGVSKLLLEAVILCSSQNKTLPPGTWMDGYAWHKHKFYACEGT